MTNPVLLGGYAAKRCPVRVHNDVSPAVQTLEWVPSPEDQARLDAGKAFEAAVFAQLMALHPDCVLVDPDLQRDDAIAATVAAMDAGVGIDPRRLAAGRPGRRPKRSPRPTNPRCRRLPARRREEPQDGKARQEDGRRPVAARATCLPTFGDGVDDCNVAPVRGRHAVGPLHPDAASMRASPRRRAACWGRSSEPARLPSRPMPRPSGCWHGTTLPNPSYIRTHAAAGRRSGHCWSATTTSTPSA